MSVVDFYLDKKNKSGYTYSTVVFTWSDDEWENVHDFIQWLFPIDTESQFNPDAPILDQKLIEYIHKDAPLLKTRICLSLQRFCSFLGLKYIYECRSTDKIVLSDVEKFENKVLTASHNWLRITRCLRCLTLLGINGPRDQLFSILKIYKDRIDSKTFDYWEKACHK